MFLIFIKAFRIDFQNGKWKYLNRKWDCLSHSRPLLKKFFYKMCLIFNKELKIDFPNKKWNYLTHFQNYATHFKASDQKPSYKNLSHFYRGVQNWFWNRNWNHQNMKWNYLTHFLFHANDQNLLIQIILRMLPQDNLKMRMTPKINTTFHIIEDLNK